MDHHASGGTRSLLHGGEGRSGGGGGGGAGNVAASSPGSRPMTARWTPTSEQIRILRELYYSCGIRSPNAEQIQRIAARLRQYGRVEGKNVFYWFQNHKARERQKKRLTTLDVTTTSAAAGVNLLALPSSGAAAAAAYSGGLQCHAGNGAPVVQQLEASTSSNCWDTTAMDTERGFVQLLQMQDYMGVRSTGGHGGGAAPWACFPAVNQTPPPMREPETLPLFPTSGRHGGGGSQHQQSVVHGGGSYLQQPNSFQCFGSTTASTAITEQHSFYSSSQEAGASLELTLSSSYCSTHPEGYM